MQEKIKTSSKPKILIFDNSPFVRDIYQKHFSKAGFKIRTFDNYDKPYVLDVVVSEKPDILFCDILMEGMNGYDAIKLLKSNKRTKDVPIIIVSNLGEKKDIEKGLKTGAAEYLIMAHYTPTQVVNIFKSYLIKSRKADS